MTIETTPPTTQTPIIRAHQLSKHYQNFTAVNAVNFEVPAGQCCGILGPNGAGKTTTLRMLVGHALPSSGELTVLGYPIPSQAREMRAHIGIVPQKDNLDPDFTVVQNLIMYGRYFGISNEILRQRMPDLLRFAALEPKADALINALSGGMQRRLSIARALVNNPQLVVLDEPTTGLDPQARQLIWQRLRELKTVGLTLVLTTHYMEEAQRLCDRLIIMDAGSILEDGSPTELIKKHIAPHVVEVHGNDITTWHQQQGMQYNLRHEKIGDTYFYYGNDVMPLLNNLANQTQLVYLHRPANLEDVFIKLTGRELRDA